MLIFGVIAAVAALDLIADAQEGASLGHRLTEFFLFTLGMVGLIAAARRLLASLREARDLRQSADELSASLKQRTEEAHQWRLETESLRRGLGEAIDRQFDRWKLSEAEREVASLLLKGLSTKEIAAIRDTTDATTRQQARAVYKKAGLSGRNDLAAFFLEDFLDLPESPGPLEEESA